jgi:ribosomal protein L7/L12
MHKLALALNSLIHNKPDENSVLLHKQFQESLDTSFDIDKLKEALDECKLMSDLNLKIKVLEILSVALHHMSANDKMNRVDIYILNNEYIKAIKLYRELFGTGLADSKAACDKRRVQLLG